MIIGNGNNSNKSFNINNNFQKNINKSISNTEQKRNVFTKDIFSIEGGNTSNSNDMYNKSLAMLNDRLEKGLITMDEFNKKCNSIAKKRSN